MLFNVICWHLSVHLALAQILYEEMDNLYDLEETNHRLLLIFKTEKPLQEASEGAWTILTKELKKIKL
tara:strand:- start:339 stop:542 length:204 start_codon:yes stop_codon:yes gene_type:complete